MRLIELLKEARKKEETLISENIGSKKNIRKQAKIVDIKKAQEARKIKKQLGAKFNVYMKKLGALINKGQIDKAIEFISNKEKFKKYIQLVIEAKGKNIFVELKKYQKINPKIASNVKKFIEMLEEEA
jgi:D-arabinose 1-dehydrogenase-like Zn-dependent alcohol dehydrogenase